VLLQEQALYEKEGLKVKKIYYTDNQDCIGMMFTVVKLLLCHHRHGLLCHRAYN